MELTSFTKIETVVEGRKMVCYEKGGGSVTCLFSSGWAVPFPLHDMHGVADALSAGRRCIVIDRFGYGYSDASGGLRSFACITRETKALCDRLHITGDIVYVGHSLATFHALDFACTFPQLCKGVALIDSYPARHAPERLAIRLNWLPYYCFKLLKALGVVGRVSDGTLQSILARRRSIPGDINAHMLALVRDAAFSPDMRSELKNVSAGLKSLFPRLDRLSAVPVTSICRSQTLGVNKRLAQSVGHLRLVNVGRSPHAIHYAHPSLVVAEVEKLCAK